MSKAWVLASVTYWLKVCTDLACASTSACVASSLANTALAVSNASFAASTAALSASWADFNFSSNVAMLAFKISFLTSAFGVSAPTFAATAAATFSFVVSATGLTATLGSSFNFSPEFYRIVYSCIVRYIFTSLSYCPST